MHPDDCPQLPAGGFLLSALARAPSLHLHPSNLVDFSGWHHTESGFRNSRCTLMTALSFPLGVFCCPPSQERSHDISLKIHFVDFSGWHHTHSGFRNSRCTLMTALS